MAKQIEVGFIGAGDISHLHAQSMRNLPNAHLKGLWDIDALNGSKKCTLFQCHQYASLAELLADPTLDAVYVLTPLEFHHQYAMQALGAGKHVFVEKPVGATIAEIKDMQELAQHQQLVCMPGHNYIYEAHIQRTKEFITTGKIGDLVAIYILYNIHHPEDVAARGEGVIRQVLTHHAYITLYLSGMPKEITALKSSLHYEELTVEDIAMVNMKLENDALVHYCASFAADDHSSDPWTMLVKVIGTQGATRFSYRDWVDNRPGEVHSQTYLAYPESILNIDAFFVDKCIVTNARPLSTLQDAMDTQKIIEAIELSVSSGKKVELD